ncbi:MAG: nucleotide sugar dehydrogenase [Planctomycetes bacterium]|nr:nucleotide sugar dehydrogenase [Planctomycetota bacterium]
MLRRGPLPYTILFRSLSRRCPLYDTFMKRLESGDLSVGVIGLGYVGLPLALTFSSRGLHVLGFDIDPSKIDCLNRGSSYIRHISSSAVSERLESGLVAFTADFDRLSEPDALLICVPTPLKDDRTPDLSFVENTARDIAGRLRNGQLVVLESTTYPGTTSEVLLPILAASGLAVERDFFLAYSPEREDPGNPDFATGNIPKVVGAVGPRSLELASALYSKIVPSVVQVSSAEVAEAAKLLENIYRAVNIALVNEMKIILDAMGIDVHEVIRAASTKPFGFQPFHPGPGWGGHCIPVDPFYLAWKARMLGREARFIEDAGWVNVLMPKFVIEKLAAALERDGKTVSGSRILVLGLAYKKNVDDTRESPAYEIIRLLLDRGAAVSFHDPNIHEMPPRRRFRDMHVPSVPLTPQTLSAADCVLIVTDHDGMDRSLIGANARLIVDTRNFMDGVPLAPGTRLVKA